MSTRKHVVRAIVLGLVGTTLAFAHPTDPGVGSPIQLSEVQQEKLAFVRYRVARAAAERAALQTLTQACDQVAGQEETSDTAFSTFDERGVLSGLDAIYEAAERNGIPIDRIAQVDMLDPNACL